jgi:hypothetical protein
MAIVWPCPLSVEAYAAADRSIEVPRPSCPSCSQVMSFWGFYTRYLGAGTGARPSALGAGLPHTTVRDWRRRVTERSAVLIVGFLSAAVALGDSVPRNLSSGVGGLVVAVDAAVGAARRRRGARGRRWLIANRIVGGQLLTTNTDPPWAAG